MRTYVIQRSLELSGQRSEVVIQTVRDETQHLVLQLFVLLKVVKVLVYPMFQNVSHSKWHRQ